MEPAEVFELQRGHSLLLRREPIRMRKQKLKGLKEWILSNRNRIREAVANDLRKLPEETDLSEIFVVTSSINKCIRELSQWTKVETAESSLTFLGTKGYVHYEPKGVCLIISPWNYPFNLAIGPLVHAIAAGNTVILKPSELSSSTSELISEMCQEVFELQEVHVVLGGVEKSTELLEMPFDHIFFTGSPRVGKIVMAAASKHLASVTLELGGKSPCVIDETADLEDAAEKISWGKWLNAGQTCLAPDYLLVHEQVKDKFLALLKEQVKKQYGRDRYSCIISKAHFERLKSWKEEAVQKGATVYYEGESDDENLRLAPCILEEISKDTHLNDHEIFGPIATVRSFKTIQEVIDLVNSRPKALSSYIFSKRKKNIQQFRDQTSAGALLINDTLIHFGHPSLPFGGVNNSGIGKSHGKYGFMEFSNAKTILKQRTGLTMAKLLYPPFNRFKKWNLDFLIKYF